MASVPFTTIGRREDRNLRRELVRAKQLPLPGSGGTASSVTDFGAVGDGVTDDTDAFVDALAAAVDVIVPPPEVEYRISDTLVVPNGHSLQGFGAPARAVPIRCTDKTKPMVEIQGQVLFGNLSLGYTQTISSSDTSAIALQCSSLRNCNILPVHVFNACYGVLQLQEQGALETGNSNPVFSNVWQHLELTSCYGHHLDLQAFNTSNTPNIFLDVRTTNFSSGTSRITTDQSVVLASNTGIWFGQLNIEHGIYTVAPLRCTSGQSLQIAELHMEGISWDNSSTPAFGIVIPASMKARIGSWKVWNNSTNPTSVKASTIAYLVKLNADSQLDCEHFYCGGVTRESAADMRLVSYGSASASSAYVRFRNMTRGGITDFLNNDDSGVMGRIVREQGAESGLGPWVPFHGDGLTEIGDEDFAYERTGNGPHFHIAGTLTANRTITASQTPVLGDQISVWREADGNFSVDVLGAAILETPESGVTVRYVNEGTATTWKVIHGS